MTNKKDFNFLVYLKLQVLDANKLKAISLLLTNNLAKLIGIPFIIGADGLVIYGQLPIMISKSELIASTDFKDITFKNIKLTETDLPAFVHVWLMINGLIDWKYMKENYNLKDLLLIREWIAYFGAENDWYID